MNTARKIEPPADWHPADVKASLAKRGYTFARIAREYGYQQTTPNTVLKRPWLRMEQIVGLIIGVAPRDIWPSRYDPDHPVRRHPTRNKPRTKPVSKSKGRRNG